MRNRRKMRSKAGLLMLIVLLALSSLPLGAKLSAAAPETGNWTFLSEPLVADSQNPISNLSLTLYESEMYASWMEYDSSPPYKKKIHMKSFDGDEWTSIDQDGSVNVDPLNGSAESPVTVVLNDRLYGAWAEATPGTYKIRVKSYGADGWRLEDKGFVNDAEETSSLAPYLTVYNDEVYVTWSGTKPSEGYGIYVKKYDGSGQEDWVSVSPASGLQHSVSPSGPKLVVYDGNLYAIWRELVEGQLSILRVSRYDGGTTWTPIDEGGLTSDPEKSMVRFYPIVYDDKLLIFSLEQNSDSTKGAIKFWSYDGHDWLPGTNGGGLNADQTRRAGEPNLVEYKGELYVTWSETDGSNLSYAVVRKYNGNTWTTVAGAGATYVTEGREPTLAVYDDDLYLAWTEIITGIFSFKLAQLREIPPGQLPGVPTNVTAVAGDGRVVVSFDAPIDEGASPILDYTVTSSPESITATADGSPITIMGLTNGTSYTFTVTARNSSGSSVSSLVSNPVTPQAVPIFWSPSVDTSVTVYVNGQAENIGRIERSARNGQSLLTLVVDEDKLTARLANEDQAAVVRVPVEAEGDNAIVEVSGRMVKELEQREADLEIVFGGTIYTIPARQIGIDSVAKQLGKAVELQNIKLQIEIAAPSPEAVQALSHVAEREGFTVVAAPVEFTIRAIHGDQNAQIDRFDSYVRRTLIIPDGVDPNKITTGVVIEQDGTIRHVPTKVIRADSRYYAEINSLTNSTYAVVWNPVAYGDVSTYWAKQAAEDMGSRMIVEGTNGLFEPIKEVTRAEFAATLVRGLGLPTYSNKQVFTDVAIADPHSGAIATAYEYRLINGFQDGAFRPNEKLTREQAMAMIAQAMDITGLKDRLTATDNESILLSYEDADHVANWARASVISCLQAGIVNGQHNTKLAPKAYVTKAETAAMIQRLLQKSGLI